jgi:hypothetical protein
MKGTTTTYYPRRRHKLNELGDSLGYDAIEDARAAREQIKKTDPHADLVIIKRVAEITETVVEE